MDSKKAPQVVTFAFKNFKVKESKWEAECSACKAVISETRGTTSGFVK